MIKYNRNCSSFSYIYDVGSCSSEWAVGPAAVASDRYCVHLGKQYQLSAEEVLTCCKDCGNCLGGSYLMAWRYMNVYIIQNYLFI